MHIVFISSARSASGGARQATYLATGLQERGHDICFFTPAKCNFRYLAPGLDWRELPDGFFSKKTSIEKALPQGTPAIVHAFHNNAVKMLSYMGTLWRIQKKTIACVAHRGVIYRPGNILPYILPGIRKFAVNSEACKKVLPVFWRKNLAEVVYNCVPDTKITPTRSPESVRKELGLLPGTRVVGSVMNNSKVKGADILLRAFARISRQDLTLCVVGLTEAIWKPLCHELGIENRVRIVAATEHVADYLQLFDLFVLPSRSESSPNALQEAMRLGLPALCANVGGVPECVGDERFLVTPEDIEGFAIKIQHLIANTALLEEAGKINLAFSSRFMLTNKLDKMEKIYSDLLSGYK